MSNLTGYELKELCGRKCFDKTFDLYQTHTLPQYHPYDTNYFSGYSTFNAEIKCRNFNINDTFRGKPNGWMLERHKYDELKKTTDEITYINFFHDGYVIWNLTNSIITEWYLYDMPVNNQSDDDSTRFKQVAYLPLSAASHIHYKSYNFEQIKSNINNKS
jgi:hypothetical protein